jgi:hypothetical protein
MRVFAAVFLVTIATAPWSAQGQEHGETRRYFKDWLAACRADGYCSATAYVNPGPGNGTVADYILRVGRHAEDTYWEISFTTVAAMADPTVSFSVGVDGAWQDFEGSAEVAAYGSINDFFLLGPKAQTVMDWLAPGSEMTIEFNDTDGARQQAVFSLAGLTASLIWIDEKQGRLGSERVAEAPPVGLDRADPDAAEGPSREGGAVAEIPSALLAQHAADTECQSMEVITNGADIEIGTVGDAMPIFFLPCWSAAYNFGWKAYVEVFEGEYAMQSFAEFSPDRGWTATTHLVNYGWDPATQSVITFNKGRGLGDCGTSGEWQWDEFAFRVVTFRSKGECDEGDPGDFPVVYSLEGR